MRICLRTFCSCHCNADAQVFSGCVISRCAGRAFSQFFATAIVMVTSRGCLRECLEKALGARNVAILAQSSVLEGSLVRNRRILATALSCRRRCSFWGLMAAASVAVTGARISCCAASLRSPQSISGDCCAGCGCGTARIVAIACAREFPMVTRKCFLGGSERQFLLSR